jgi:hypothetical protein
MGLFFCKLSIETIAHWILTYEKYRHKATHLTIIRNFVKK